MRQKPLLPSLREKKRYLTFEILSDASLNFREVSDSIKNSYRDMFGFKGLSEAGLIFMQDKFDMAKGRGLVRVSHDCVDNLRASLAMITEINSKKAIARSITVSGMIHKAEEMISA